MENYNESEAAQPDNKVQELMLTKRDQFRVEIRRKNNAEFINLKRIKFCLDENKSVEEERKIERIEEKVIFLKIIEKNYNVFFT